MGSLMKQQAERFLREKKRHRRWLAIFLCLALLVSSGTFAALRMNGQAMDDEGKALACQYQVHTHGDECFDENGKLICGQADYVVHEHSAECYDMDGNLVCPLEERLPHVHDSSCYTEEEVLTCGLEESPGHQHAEECYDMEGNLICGYEEGEGSHQHTEECYSKESTLTCGELELHTHDDTCYDVDGNLICEKTELKEHVHNEECFVEVSEEESQAAGVGLSGEAPQEEAHVHDDSCYQETRILVCGQEESAGHQHTEECMGEDGAVICGQEEGQGAHQHTDECYSAEKILTCEISGTEGEGETVSQDTVSQDTVSQDSTDSADTDKSAAKEFKYEDERVQINVRAAEEGIIPENAELSVKPILQQDVEELKADKSVSENAVAEAEELNAKYEEVQKELEASVAEDESKEIAGFLAYDISFLTEQENKETGETEKIEVEPDGNVEVEMKFADAYIPELSEPTVTENLVVDVVHMKETDEGENGTTKLNAEVLDAEITATEGAKVSTIKFEADRFSTFTINWNYVHVSAEITYWDIDAGTEIDLGENKPNDIDLENGETFVVDDIKPGGKREEYFYIRNGENNELYAFVQAKNTWIDNEKNPSNPKTAGQEVTELGCGRNTNKNKYDIGWKMKGDTEFRYNNETAKVKQDKFYFLYRKAEPAEIGRISTVDSEAQGVEMYIHDYSSGDKLAGDKTIKQLLGGVWANNDDGRNAKSNLVQSKLGADGYPITNGQSGGANGVSLSGYFGNGKSINHLFSSDVYTNTDTEGTFSYDSDQNYAYLGDYNALDATKSNDFTVYNAVGTPDGEDAPYAQRGNFFPFNQIVPGYYAKNAKHHNGRTPFYKTVGINFNFSMYLKTNFVQGEGGFYNKKPMKYEFRGDDDLWVFIDDYLVLDIGGVHDAREGWIDFSTGDVWVEKREDINTDNEKEVGTTTTLKDIFRPYLSDQELKDGFTGNTFKDWTEHTLKMFYMERNDEGNGLGGSNLKVSFNLPTIPKDKIWVSKRLSNSDQGAYTNKEFEFKVWAQKQTGGNDGAPVFSANEYEVLSENAVYRGTSEEIQFDNDGIFKLKPGQTAEFGGLHKTRKYYVEELGIDKNEYDQIQVNTTYTTVSENGTEGAQIQSAKTDSISVGDKKSVVFTNHCSTENSRELRITKKIAGSENSSENDEFTALVQLEDTSGDLAAYEGKYYLIRKDRENGTEVTNWYYKDENGRLVSNGSEAKAFGTANGGEITIIPGYTAVITGLTKGTDFLVTEEMTDDQKQEYDTNYDKSVVQDLPYVGSTESEISGSDGCIKLGTDAEVIIINKRKVNYTWKILKKSATNVSGNGLPDAEFTLTPVLAEGQADDTRTTYIGKSENVDGGIVWYPSGMEQVSANAVSAENIEKGHYVLKETMAPAGYALGVQEWKIELTLTGITITDINPTKTETIQKDGKDVTEYTYIFTNQCVYELPSTGGTGIYWYLVSGMMLMMASALIIYRNRVREVVGK